MFYLERIASFGIERGEFINLAEAVKYFKMLNDGEEKVRIVDHDGIIIMGGF